MTRKELVAALEANFAEDEEVTFVYNDDQGEVRETAVEVRDHERETAAGHWEYDGKTVIEYSEVKEMYRARKGPDGRALTFSDLQRLVRWVSDGGTVKDVKRVVYVG